MNSRIRSTRNVLAAMLLAAVAAPVAAQKPMPSLPPVQAQAVLYVADCEERALPSQREVGEWTGQHNFSQVYATRQRLMGEIGRACQKDGIEQVRVVLQATAAATELVAMAEPRR
ncbi:hypothetical protein [Lysobacter solisilvae (ex Woo and Kim 2020)]|uniref:UrcA family protein n=1 Tax=Agrilutibacter terrestris TaxID=2865112 RepID=A0A7H0G0Z9_9GAMM|nr:hypothetical protein [Lysobacter terrestris]QNP41965.1 hypothetical protein H8B22_07165 [Lysobacter terrestris]